MRGTPNSRVGRARFMSSTKVSRLSAKNTVVPRRATPSRRTSAPPRGTARQVGEHPVVFAGAEQFHAAAGGEGETAEVVHHPLGHAGGSGGVDQGGELLGSGRRVAFERRAGLQVAPLAVETPFRVQRHGHGRYALGDSGRHRRPIVELADEDHRRLGMLQHLARRLGGEIGIEGDGNVPGHPDRQVSDDPVRTVLRDDRDTAAGGEIQAAQPGGCMPRLVAHLAPAQLLDPAATDGLHQVTPLRMTLALEEDFRAADDLR